METLHPDQAWQLKAACLGDDPVLFDWKDVEDLSGILGEEVSYREVRSLNELYFLEAKKSCNFCPVIEECEADAQYTGAYPWGVRGGLSPYDRPGIRPGYPVAADDMIEEKAAHDRVTAWNHFLKGTPTETLPEGLQAMLTPLRRAYVDGREPDAEWSRYYNPMSGRTYGPGVGWAISQDATRTVVKIMWQDGRGRLMSRFVNSRHVVYDVDITPRKLIEWPDGVDLPNTH